MYYVAFSQAVRLDPCCIKWIGDNNGKLWRDSLFDGRPWQHEWTIGRHFGKAPFKEVKKVEISFWLLLLNWYICFGSEPQWGHSTRSHNRCSCCKNRNHKTKHYHPTHKKFSINWAQVLGEYEFTSSTQSLQVTKSMGKRMFQFNKGGRLPQFTNGPYCYDPYFWPYFTFYVSHCAKALVRHMST